MKNSGICRMVLLLTSVCKHTLGSLLAGIAVISCSILLVSSCSLSSDGKTAKSHESIERLREGFLNPPDSARPGVYWYFMDGNLSREAMTADLQSMKEAGIGNLVFLAPDRE